jgi:hypothetical protein
MIVLVDLLVRRALENFCYQRPRLRVAIRSYRSIIDFGLPDYKPRTLLDVS